MHVSVILSTYNQPDWLEKTLWGYACQEHGDFEIVIADDGSTEETKHRIEKARDDTGLALQHVWQEDDGFRKCAALNKAIAAASGDYLLFSDGDCIPRRDFVATHARLAEPGWFLSGGYFKLPRDVSEAITREDVEHGRHADPRWLRARGVRGGWKMLKLSARGWAVDMLNATTTTKPTWNGHGSSGWKADLVDANGFDERMGWGGEDRELGERLVNAGLRGKQVRYCTTCVHLDHGRPWKNQEALDRNAAIRRETRRTKRTRTEFGIEKHDTPG